MSKNSNDVSIAKVATAGALSWLLPGAGHIFLGDRKRGAILFIVITATFWTGVAIGGVQSTVQPQKHKLWFMGQVCCGAHTLITYFWGRAGNQSGPDPSTSHISEDVAVVYTGIAGMLNILIILDCLASADPSYVRTASRPPPRQGAT